MEQIKSVIFTRDISIMFGSTFSPLECFLGAYDSEGKAVDQNIIKVDGKVNTRELDTYPVIFSFTDPITQGDVSQTALVTVVKTLEI